MNIYSHFCNICWQYNDTNLKNICEEDMVHLKETLFAFIGRADIINKNTIYLCKLCCEELIHFTIFRGRCLSNLIPLRQLYFHEILNLESKENKRTVKNISDKLLYDEILRYNSFGKSGSIESITSYLEEMVRKYSELNKTETIVDDKIIKLSTEINEFDSIVEKSGTRNFKLESFETVEFVEEQVLNSENECTKEKLHNINEVVNTTSQVLDLENIENESSINMNLKFTTGVDVKYDNNYENVNSQSEFCEEVLNIKQENNTTEDLKLGKIQNEFGDDMNFVFQISNVHTSINMQDYGHRVVGSKRSSKVGKKLQSGRCNGNLTAGTIHKQRRPGQKILTINPSAQLYKCTVCDKTFAKANNLTNHKRVHSGQKPHKCNDCNKAFKHSSGLTNHSRTHSGARPYNCTDCEKAFKTAQALTIHSGLHSNDRPYKCKLCDKAFRFASNLYRHEFIHKRSQLHECPVCNWKFRKLSNLVRHERKHDSNKAFQCTVCDKVFVYASNLARHMKIHSSISKNECYKCTDCDKVFSTASHLSRHKRVVSEIGPYKCPVCEKECRNLNCLSIHQRTHVDDRPHKYTVSDETLTRSSNLTK